MDLRMFVALRARFWAASKISLCRCRCSGLSLLLLLLLLLLPTSMFIIVLVELISVWKYEKEVNHDLTSVYNGILLYWFSSTSGQCYKHFKGKSRFPQNYQAKNVFFCAFQVKLCRQKQVQLFRWKEVLFVDRNRYNYVERNWYNYVD